MGQRRVWAAIAAGMVALAILPVGMTSAADDSSNSVSVTKTGWWSNSNQELNTTNGAIAPPLPKSPLVPDDSLPVTALFGTPQNISAVGFGVPEGMDATKLVLTLPLSDGGGADSGGSSAKIAACAVTSYWEGGDNGKWDAKPDYDCSKGKAVGKRNDDGSWTFDLAPIVTLWADEFEDVAQPDGGVVLVPDPDDATTTFQVAYAKDGINVDAAVEKASTPGDSSFTADVSQETIPAGTPTYSVDTGALPAPSAGAPGASRGGSSAGGGRRIAANRFHDAGNVGGNLPLGMLLLVPFLLLLAILAGQSVSAGRGRPEQVRRQGGVGRALAARAARPARRSRPEVS